MKKTLFSAICLTITVCFFLTSIAFAASPLIVKVSRVDITAFPEVTVQFSAWDSNGIPLTDLTAQDLFLKEDDSLEFHPTSLQSDTNAQLSVVLVMDVSGSMAGQPLEDAQNAANRFLTKLDQADQAAVIAFSRDVLTDPAILDPAKEIGFSSNLSGAFNLIEGLKAEGATEVYNAVEKAVRMSAILPTGNRAILLLTDGKNDPAEVGDPEASITLAKESNIPVFAIGLGNDIDETYLARLTSETGGIYRLTPHSSDLGTLFNDMATLLKTDYTMTYTSSLQPDGQNHSLTVRAQTLAGEVSAVIDTGTLPQAPEGIAQPVETDETENAMVSQAEAALDEHTGQQGMDWLDANRLILIICAVFVIVVAVVLGVMRRRKPGMVEKCAKCGTELHDSGPCPMCGGIKRITARKK